MRIWCLTKLTISPLPNNFFEPEIRTPNIQRMPTHDISTNDFYSWEKIQEAKNLLKDPNLYALSEIQIGKRKNGKFYFLLYRNNIKYLDIEMTKGCIQTREEIKTAESPVIDLIIDNSKISEHFRMVQALVHYKYIKEIRLRGIKNTSNYKFTDEESKCYKKYITEINNISGGDFEKQEKVFIELGPIKLPNPSSAKGMRTKVQDLYKAIKDICDPEIGSMKNYSARNNSNIMEEEELRMDDPYRYDVRSEKTRDFSKCRLLRYESVNIPKINEKWFKAENLLELSFKNVNVFESLNVWKIFEKHFGSFKKLIILEISGSDIIEFPESLIKKLPKCLNCLILEKNKLIKISECISELENLKILNLSENVEITNEGIPWNKLPENLEVLELKGTKITKVPKEIDRLKKLITLNIQVEKLEEINLPVNWDSLIDGINKNLYISGVAANSTNFVSALKSTDKLTLMNAELKDIHDTEIPDEISELNLSQNKIEHCLFQKEFYRLKELNLSHNQIKSISWETLPDSLETIDLSHNELTFIGPVSHLKRLEYFYLHHNQIKELSSDFNQLHKLREINLSNNKLTQLPKGFELILHEKHEINGNHNILSLDISFNEFSFTSGNLKEELWNRLTELHMLTLNGNHIYELDCSLVGRVGRINAVDCGLHYICPQIYSSLPPMNRIELNLSKNPNLKNFSFLPKIIFQPITNFDEEEAIEDCFVKPDPNPNKNNDEGWGSIIVTDKPNFRKIKKFPVDKFIHKPKYEFKNVEETSKEQEYKCKCCAYCGYGKHGLTDGEEEGPIMVQQQMIMDFSFVVVKEEDLEADGAYFAIFVNNPGWGPGKWKTKVRTRLCRPCIKILKQQTDEAYEIYKNQKDAEENKNIELKKSRVTVENNENPRIMENNENPRIMENNENPRIMENIENIQEPVWIKYFLEGQEQNIVLNFDHIYWPYRFPNQEFLIGLCNALNLPFSKHIFGGLENYYESIILGKTNLFTKKIQNDEDSGFRSLSYLLTGNENSHESIRNLIFNHISGGFLNQNFYLTYENQISQTFKNTRMRECEIYAASHLFQINIFLFNNQSETKWFLFNESFFDLTMDGTYGCTQFYETRPSILLSCIDNDHYDTVLAAN